MGKVSVLIAALAVVGLAGCENLTDEQQVLRDQGRPFLYAEADGIKAYRWDIPQPGTNGSTTLYFIPGATTREACGNRDNNTCPVTAAGPAVAPPTPREAALAKLTPEEKQALGIAP